MRPCPSCGGDCGYTKKKGCQYQSGESEWVGLTLEEFAEILCDDRWQGRPELMMLQVQAKLKERNT